MSERAEVSDAHRVRDGRPTHRVIATAGHVDHGKSSLVARLTGIDPDRWPEEKRRGLTIDLGYAWCRLPSGREVGFVDVPGHERFIRNMLAGVGPVPVVLFVVAADEGWKPQSEEHLEILDVLGVSSGVVALTKRDLVDDEMLEIAADDVRERLTGASLADAPVITVSSTTGDGLDELRTALDDVVDRTPPPRAGPVRLFIDRAFTIKGAGTVATGTLTGDCLTVGDEVAIEPGDRRTRVRSLQTHRAAEQAACPVSRVAANLVGIEHDDVERGDVMTTPQTWVPTSSFDIELRAVRSLGTPLTSRGAFKVYAGAAEADTTIRLLEGNRLEPGATTFARLRTSSPLVVAIGDRVVIREAGRRRTVGGGVVLDVAPGKASGAPARLAARLAVSPGELAGVVVREHGAMPADDVPRLAGTEAATALDSVVGSWAVDPELRATVERVVESELDGFHGREPLALGASVASVRRIVAASFREAGAPADPDLVEAVLDTMTASGALERVAGVVRLAGHRVSLERHDPDVQRLLDAVSGDHEAMPPTITELGRAGVGRDVVEAASRAGVVTQVSSELVFAPAFVERARSIVETATGGITVSAFREALGTTRKFALPLLEYFDRTGVSRRDGDLRFPR